MKFRNTEITDYSHFDQESFLTISTIFTKLVKKHEVQLLTDDNGNIHLLWEEGDFQLSLVYRKKQGTVVFRADREEHQGWAVATKWWRKLTADKFFSYYDMNAIKKADAELVKQFIMWGKEFREQIEAEELARLAK